jgi:ankyrin repeat protein
MTRDPRRLRAALAQAPAQLDDGTYFATPLGLAVHEGASEMAEVLLAAGADPGLRDRNGLSPLEIAVEQEQQELAELLRRHGG